MNGKEAINNGGGLPEDLLADTQTFEESQLSPNEETKLKPPTTKVKDNKGPAVQVVRTRRLNAGKKGK